jgi:hypothetical protein
MMFISHRLLQPAEVEGEEKRMGTGEIIGKLIPTYVRQTAPYTRTRRLLHRGGGHEEQQKLVDQANRRGGRGTHAQI